MRLIYMGTPQFAVGPLRALVAAGHDVAAVVTRTDKPAGRGRGLAIPPVKAAALELGLPVHQPKRVREPAFIASLAALTPQVIVVAAYGQILPKEILLLPHYGCVNIHASLLPAYRGAAPVNWAILRGERETGITIMQMDEGMDTGAILLQERIPIGDAETAATLLEKLSCIGAKLIGETLSLLAAGRLVPQAQDAARATVAPLLRKEDGLIDWTQPAVQIRNRVRGLLPWPGAFGTIDGKVFKILAAETDAGLAEPGILVRTGRDGLAAGTGDGLLRIVTIQPEGKRPMSAAEFLRGHGAIVGSRFDRRMQGKANTA